jgi:hypothetical protein
VLVFYDEVWHLSQSGQWRGEYTFICLLLSPVCIDNNKQMKLYYPVCMDNNREMKLYYPVCMDNNREMKLYYPVCMENNRQMKVYSPRGWLNLVVVIFDGTCFVKVSIQLCLKSNHISFIDDDVVNFS